MEETEVYIPLDLIEEFLKRLPTKALCRFKCVSKEWRTLISSTPLSREKLILVGSNLFLYSVDLVELKKENVSELMATEVELDCRCSAIECHSNGLIATSHVIRNDRLLLVNPTTREFKKVYPRNVLLPKDHRVVSVDVPGFGYHSSTDDYKFVSIVHCNIGKVEGKPVPLVLVHSLKSNSVRMDIKLPDYYDSFYNLKTAFMNGCIHWLCNSGSLSSSFIAIFDLKLEEFKEMRIPRVENVISYNSLDVFGGRLCVFAAIGDGLSKEMWVMKEYGVSESWMKISIDGLGNFNVVPLYLLGDREVLLKVVRFDDVVDRLVVYNEVNNTIRDVRIIGVPTRSFQIEGICVESLVSPKHLYGLKRMI